MEKHYYEKDPAFSTDHTLYHDIACEHRVTKEEWVDDIWSLLRPLLQPLHYEYCPHRVRDKELLEFLVKR